MIGIIFLWAFIIILLSMFEKYCHELGHMFMCKVHGIKSKVKINWKKYGRFHCDMSSDADKLFRKLPFRNKSQILIAGVVVHIFFFIVYISLFFLIKNTNKFLFLILAINSVLEIIINTEFKGSDGWYARQFRKGLNPK